MPSDTFSSTSSPMQPRCILIPRPSWGSPPIQLAAGSDEIHIWRANLDQPEALLTELAGFLSPHEEERANRYRFQKDRNRFICCRGILRCIISRYSELDPRSVRVEYGRYGKPTLETHTTTTTLKFNLSHSYNLALYSITSRPEIGIDVEHVRPIMDANGIVERYLTPGEHAIYRSLPPDKKPEAFFNSWTLKEAYLKAIGCGLREAVNPLEIPLAEAIPPRLSRPEGVSEKGDLWSFYALTPEYGYVAAVAVQGPSCWLRFWEWA